MSQIFLIQVICAFFVGGGLIAFISFAAEKASKEVAGIILSFPSTLAISLLFMGFATSGKEVARIIPSTFLPMCGAMLFAVAYVYASRWTEKLKLGKAFAICICIFVGLTVWFLIALPVAIFKPEDFVLGLFSYICVFLFVNYFLSTKPNVQGESPKIKYSGGQKIFRAIFSGAVVALAVFLSKTLNPFWGGIFSMFPAAFSSSFAMIHWHHDSTYLFRVTKNVAIGSISMIMYLLTSIISFEKYGPLAGTLIAYTVSFLYSFAIAKVRR